MSLVALVELGAIAGIDDGEISSKISNVIDKNDSQLIFQYSRCTTKCKSAQIYFYNGYKYTASSHALPRTPKKCRSCPPILLIPTSYPSAA